METGPYEPMDRFFVNIVNMENKPFLLDLDTRKSFFEMRYAILDLGTNTFNLLIIETGAGEGAKIIMSRKEPVKLGQNGITMGRISEEAFDRGVAAIGRLVSYIKGHKVEQVHAFATSAIRSAANGLEFVSTIYRKYNIGIQVISGDKEAELIYLGVKQVVDMGDRKHLILDIGGGSNELIIADSRKIYWKKSYPLGMARMLEQFVPSDPIREDEVLTLENHFSLSMGCFLEAAMEHSPGILIGSSGSFDTFRDMLQAMHTPPVSADPVMTSYIINPGQFFTLTRKLIESDSEERMKMEGMDPMRVEMIVIAAIFVNFIVKRLNIGLIVQSDFALKEGAISEILNQSILSA